MRSLITLFAVFYLASIASATDWLTLPSTYSHDSASGTRVIQHTAIAPPTAPMPSNFRTSGHTHTRSSLNYGPSSDNYHRVEKWGEPVRPYGEWRFPFRPYSTPYPNWGAPYAGFNLGFGFPAYGGGGYGGHGRGHQAPHDGHGSSEDHKHGPKWRGSHERGLLGGGRWPSDRSQGSTGPLPASPYQPYPIGPGSPYPVPPYYDGYYPPYRQ